MAPAGALAMKRIRELQSRSSRNAIKSSSYQADAPLKLVSPSKSANSLKSANLSCLQRDFRGMSMTSNQQSRRSTTKIILPVRIKLCKSHRGTVC